MVNTYSLSDTYFVKALVTFKSEQWNNGNKSLQGLKTWTRTRTRPQGPG